MKIVVVGGGIAGLAAARARSKSQRPSALPVRFAPSPAAISTSPVERIVITSGRRAVAPCSIREAVIVHSVGTSTGGFAIAPSACGWSRQVAGSVSTNSSTVMPSGSLR